MNSKMESDSKSNGAASTHSTSSLNNVLPNEEELVPTLLKGSIDPVYEGKAQVLNSAIQDIGMGWYQWQLFLVVGGSYIKRCLYSRLNVCQRRDMLIRWLGFGWASDNLWPIVTSLILPAITSEFNPSKPPLLSLSQNIGLLVGAIFWGFGCMRLSTTALPKRD